MLVSLLNNSKNYKPLSSKIGAEASIQPATIDKIPKTIGPAAKRKSLFPAPGLTPLKIAPVKSMKMPPRTIMPPAA